MYTLHTFSYAALLSIILALDHLILSVDTKRNEKRQCHPSLALVGLAIGTMTDICKLKQAQSKWMCANRRQFDSRGSERVGQDKQANNETKETSTRAESFTSLTEKLVELYQRKVFINHVLCTIYTLAHRTQTHSLFTSMYLCCSCAFVRSLIHIRIRTESLLIFSFVFCLPPPLLSYLLTHTVNIRHDKHIRSTFIPTWYHQHTDTYVLTWAKHWIYYTQKSRPPSQC